MPDPLELFSEPPRVAQSTGKPIDPMTGSASITVVTRKSGALRSMLTLWVCDPWRLRTIGLADVEPDRIHRNDRWYHLLSALRNASADEEARKALYPEWYPHVGGSHRVPELFE